MSESPDKNDPQLLMKRAVMWLGLLADHADIEPAETVVKVSLPDGRVLGQVTLADDISALEYLVGKSVFRLSDADTVEVIYADEEGAE